MGRAVIVESSFLIDLEREHKRGKAGPAIDFMEANEDARLYITFTVAGEMAAGVSMSDRARWEAFLGPFYVLQSSPEVCWHYGKTYRYLKDNARLIGGNDLWIAATALAYDMPLVTRNEEHFRRVPGLDLAPYAPQEPDAR
ncbi:MAG: type II toxin-antitoxin system VapC family toxin [Vicinamibacterales bacterium]